jgi:PPM family protein phosphatase
VNASSALGVRSAVATDIGVVRDRNEDAAHADPDGRFFIVADGMGGHAAGDVAAAMTIDVIRRRLDSARREIAAFAASPNDLTRERLDGILTSAIREANRAIRARARREGDKHGMGSTVEIVVIAGSEAFVAHVGDSRTYLVRDGAATQLTRDHTMAQVMVAAGTLAADQVHTSPMSAVLLNAIGVTAEIAIDIEHHQLRPDDQLLLCSDGLYDYLPPDEIAARLADGDAARALSAMIELARSRGGHDNITGIVVEAHAAHLIRDPWDEETTSIRELVANPLAAIGEDTLVRIVEYALHEDSAPHR